MENLADFLLLAAGILWGIELIPQLIKTCKLKDTSGISVLFCITCCLAYATYTVGACMKGYWVVVLAHVPSMVLWTVMLLLVIKYRRKE